MHLELTSSDQGLKNNDQAASFNLKGPMNCMTVVA